MNSPTITKVAERVIQGNENLRKKPRNWLEKKIQRHEIMDFL
jgi:hypothetical protein